jgi:hypothetical protein
LSVLQESGRSFKRKEEKKKENLLKERDENSDGERKDKKVNLDA